MEKDDLKNIVCSVLLAFVALCVICSIVTPDLDLLPLYAAGAVIAALGAIIIDLTR